MGIEKIEKQGVALEEAQKVKANLIENFNELITQGMLAAGIAPFGEQVFQVTLRAQASIPAKELQQLQAFVDSNPAPISLVMMDTQFKPRS